MSYEPSSKPLNLWLKTVATLAISAGLGNTDIGQVLWGQFVKKTIRKVTETRFVLPRGMA